MNNKVIGIIGGMGPEATGNLFLKIIKATSVKKDQDHFRVVIDSNPQIPDRTEAILGNGVSPLAAIIKTGKNLEKLGVDIGCIPCITAHYYINEIQRTLSYPVINALEELEKYINYNYPDVTRVGVLATVGTVKAGLFDKYLSSHTIIYPNNIVQKEKIMKAIYGKDGIKSGNTEGNCLNLLIEAGNGLIDSGAQIIVAGCTEVGLVLKPSHFDKPLVDPIDVMAKAVVREDIIYEAKAKAQ